MYNILLLLSRNLFFYKRVGLSDSFETRIYLMFVHFSIFLIISKKKKIQFDQKKYDKLFHQIENNLREMGFGDVSVNKKMKDLNKILYDILLKIDLEKFNNKNFRINSNLIKSYFSPLINDKSTKLAILDDYFSNFFKFCFDLSFDKMVEESIKFNINYGRT